MRQIGTLSDADDARRLADYLATLAIETRLDAEGDGWAVWVCDEDRVARAREVFAEFRADPKNARFRAPPRPAAVPHAPEEEAPAPARDPLEEPPSVQPPLTLALILCCVAVGAASNFGGYGFDSSYRDPEEKPPRLVEALLISSYDITRREGKTYVDWTRYSDDPQAENAEKWLVRWVVFPFVPRALGQVRHGEVWRLVTPIFIHFGIPHLLFNMLMLFSLGGMIEQRRGSWVLALLVVAIAIPSNLAQFSMIYLKPVIGEESLQRFGLGGGPAFGGFSGVLYGLFGYILIKSWLQPQQGLIMHSSLVAVMIGWFLFCFTGLVGPVANVCHAAGLLVGLAIGYLSYLWSLLFR